MRTLNGQMIYPDSGQQLPDPLSPQTEFVDFVTFHGISELIQSLRCVHDMALYYSDIPIGDEERTALFDVKVLWEALEKLNSD